jgi:hypothetical protein
MTEPREINIKIIVGDNPSPYSSGSHMAAGMAERNNFEIYINTRQADAVNVPLWVLTAHELGHVLGRAFNTPHHSNLHILHPDYTLEMENDAWDMAEVTMHMKRVREFAIGFYKRPAEEQMEFARRSETEYGLKKKEQNQY